MKKHLVKSRTMKLELLQLLQQDPGPSLPGLVKREVGEYVEACPSSRDTIMPRVGTNTRNQQRFLVNGLSSEFGRLVQLVQVRHQEGHFCLAQHDVFFFCR